MSEVNKKRRNFINTILTVAGTATAGSIVYPIFRFLLPPQTAETEATSVVAAKVSEVPINSAKIFKFGNKPGILIRLSEQTFLAFSAKCTHLDCIVQYKEDRKIIWCACHGGVYDLTGKNIAGPPPRPLEAFKVNILGDKVIVSKG
jgi:Rieske Fe-S protein